MNETTSKTLAAVILLTCSIAIAALPASADDEQQLRKATIRAVRLIEQTSAKFLETRKCFTCHTQTLSTMVLREARRQGFDVNQQNYKRQVERALEFHSLIKSRKPGGIRVDTVGYALWALDIGQHAPDGVTEDMTWYLLNYQKDLGHWKTTVHRPPTEASDFSTNYVAIRALNRYGTPEQRKEIAARTAAVKQWLASAVTADTEDQVFRLRLAHELKIAPQKTNAFVEKLIGEQRDDGGWAQKPEMKSDAYATGSVLVALHKSGGVPSDDPAWKRGIDYLLQTQGPDGSWHVVTRSQPEQVYFESGFPHGKDQFISAFATGWATTALLLTLREESP